MCEPAGNQVGNGGSKYDPEDYLISAKGMEKEPKMSKGSEEPG